MYVYLQNVYFLIHQDREFILHQSFLSTVILRVTETDVCLLLFWGGYG